MHPLTQVPFIHTSATDIQLHRESVDCLGLYLKLLPNAEDGEAVREIMRLANGALLNRML